MSYNLRMRRVAFDNIAVGSATGRERVKGSNSTELLARENFTPGTAAVRTTDGLDHIITQTGGRTTGYVNEKIINAN